MPNDQDYIDSETPAVDEMLPEEPMVDDGGEEEKPSVGERVEDAKDKYEKAKDWKDRYDEWKNRKGPKGEAGKQGAPEAEGGKAAGNKAPGELKGKIGKPLPKGAPGGAPSAAGGVGEAAAGGAEVAGGAAGAVEGGAGVAGAASGTAGAAGGVAGAAGTAGGAAGAAGGTAAAGATLWWVVLIIVIVLIIIAIILFLVGFVVGLSTGGQSDINGNNSTIATEGGIASSVLQNINTDNDGDGDSDGLHASKRVIDEIKDGALNGRDERVTPTSKLLGFLTLLDKFAEDNNIKVELGPDWFGPKDTLIEGHTYLAGGTNNVSNHARGRAIDIAIPVNDRVAGQGIDEILMPWIYGLHTSGQLKLDDLIYDGTQISGGTLNKYNLSGGVQYNYDNKTVYGIADKGNDNQSGGHEDHIHVGVAE